MDSIQLDRVAGTLLGLACGDALGAGYEGRVPGPKDPRMIGGGYGPWDPGEWTDDTQMALCIAEVTAAGSVDPEEIGDRFLGWLHGGASDVGIQTRSVLTEASSGADLAARAQEHFARHPHAAAGNGSLMRTAPVALAHLGDDEAIGDSARAVSLLTHGDPLAAEACVLWCIAIDRAIREGRLDGIRDGLAMLDDASRTRWETSLHEAESEPAETFTGNGFVVGALQAAYASIVQTPVREEQPGRHFRSALAAAVSIGGDTDTVAAIAGALLGARWGSSAIPAGWLAVLNGWPGYTARDLTRLAVLTQRGGNPDPTGWPSIRSMVPHYEGLGGFGATAIALPDDESVVIGDMGGLSLPCRRGRRGRLALPHGNRGCSGRCHPGGAMVDRPGGKEPEPGPPPRRSRRPDLRLA